VTDGRTDGRTDVVELIGLLRQQEARENFEACRLIDFCLKLEQRLYLIFTEPDGLETTRAQADVEAYNTHRLNARLISSLCRGNKCTLHENVSEIHAQLTRFSSVFGRCLRFPIKTR